MPTPIREAAEHIDQRIGELKRELDQLETARRALAAVAGSDISSVRRKPRGPGTSSKRARPGAQSRVDRGAEFKALVDENANLRPAEAAKAMGISSQQVHGIIKRLMMKGELSRSTDKSFTVLK